MKPRLKPDTRCVLLADDADPWRASSPPLYQTATFRQPSADEMGAYDYSRTDNPTRALAERQLAALEGARHALAYASGMAAIAALLRLLEPGEEIVAGDDLYGGTTRLLAEVAPRTGIAVRFVDVTAPDEVAAALGPRTRLLLLETPSNPQLRIAPLAELAELAHRRGVRVAVDNSLLSPLLQRPLEHGADLVVYSATKILGGHGDLTAGAVITDDPSLRDLLAFHRNAEGTALAPFDAWLLMRGLKTLALRVERQSETAATIAAYLASSPVVERTYSPALPDHPGRALHRRQSRGSGPLVSFTTGDPARSAALVESLEIFSIAVSFGAVGSAATLPCRMSHASVPAALRGRLGPPPDLVRLAIGLEHPDDLLADLDRALAGVGGGRAGATGPSGPVGKRCECATPRGREIPC